LVLQVLPSRGEIGDRIALEVLEENHVGIGAETLVSGVD